MKDANGKILSIGDKVHPVGKGSAVRYIIEFNKDTVGISSDKNCKPENAYGVLPNKLVKFKNQ